MNYSERSGRESLSTGRSQSAYKRIFNLLNWIAAWCLSFNTYTVTTVFAWLFRYYTVWYSTMAQCHIFSRLPYRNLPDLDRLWVGGVSFGIFRVRNGDETSPDFVCFRSKEEKEDMLFWQSFYTFYIFYISWSVFFCNWRRLQGGIHAKL